MVNMWWWESHGMQGVCTHNYKGSESVVLMALRDSLYRCAQITFSSNQSFMLTTVDWSISTCCGGTLVPAGHYCIITRNLILLPTFTYVNIGANGRMSDGAVFNNCTFSRAMKDGTLNLPNDEALPKSTTEVPYVIVADEAFALHQHLIKPYPR